MAQVMEGVRVVEVAEHTFVPAAAAVLSDWGADVIKIEHPVRGDAMRGLGQTGVIDLSKGVHVLNEHSNRGKRSIGLDIAHPEGLEVFYELVKSADVLLVNKRPRTLESLKIDEETIRKIHPQIIYVRGTAYGPEGPDGNTGGYDMTGFWCRAGNADAISPPGMGAVLPQPGPAYGDSLGGLTIAGGISAALFRRERTGEAGSVDVSLLSMGMWAMSATIAVSLQAGEPWNVASLAQRGGPGNPLTGLYKTSDDRFLSLVMLQAFHYWPDFCEHIDRPDLISDARFDSHENLSQNAQVAREIIAEVIATKTMDAWTERFQTLKGQWTRVQNTLEVAADPQARANGYMQTAQTREGTPFELVETPVQFDHVPSGTERAPEFNEHCDEVLAEIGLEMDRILELKAAGAVA